jgi:hypothetical protein
MPKENPSAHNMVHLFIQPSEGEPVSLRVNLTRATKLLTVIAFVMIGLFWGTLFFFRELETNRKLQAEILEHKLKLQLKTLSEPQAIAPNRQLGYTVNLNEDEDLKKVSSQSKLGNAESDKLSEKESWMALTGSPVSARLGSLSSECQADNCTVKLELLPAGNGVCQGELMIVLETEVPRIGTRGVSTSQRKQFILYPGYTSREELNLSNVTNFEKRPFRFSKTLNASVNFKVTKLLRPIALNVYLFDTRKTLIHHERKVIDLDENYAN